MISSPVVRFHFQANLQPISSALAPDAGALGVIPLILQRWNMRSEFVGNCQIAKV